VLDSLWLWGLVITLGFVVVVGGSTRYITGRARRYVDQAEQDLINVRKEYVQELKEYAESVKASTARIRALEIDVTNLTLENRQLQDLLTRREAEARLRDEHLAEFYGALANIPANWAARILASLKTARPPAIAPAHRAVRRLPNEALHTLVALLDQPWLDGLDGRGRLLEGLDRRFVNKVSRHDAPASDLTSICLTAFSFGAETFRAVLDNAATLLNGSEPGKALRQWRTTYGFEPRDLTPQ
jgi:hypothetical protein